MLVGTRSIIDFIKRFATSRSSTAALGNAIRFMVKPTPFASINTLLGISDLKRWRILIVSAGCSRNAVRFPRFRRDVLVNAEETRFLKYERARACPRALAAQIRHVNCVMDIPDNIQRCNYKLVFRRWDRNYCSKGSQSPIAAGFIYGLIRMSPDRRKNATPATATPSYLSLEISWILKHRTGTGFSKEIFSYLRI